MKESIWGYLGRYLANTIEKANNLLFCRVAGQISGQTLPGSTLEKSFCPHLSEAGQHTGRAAHKSNPPRFALLSHHLLLVLMSCGMSFLLIIAMQAMTTMPAMAAGLLNQAGQPPPGPPPPPFLIPYTTGLCIGWTQGTVPDDWNSSGVCTAPAGQSFIQSPGAGGCAKDWLEETDINGNEICVLTVSSIRSECPIGFTLDGGRCDYEPDDRIGWEVGLCEAFQTGEVPPAWIQDKVCQTNPVPDPQSPILVQSGGNGSCPQHFIAATSRTGQAECALEVPSFKGQCPIGFALNGGQCDYQPVDSGIWQAGYCKSLSSDEVPVEWMQQPNNNGGVCSTNPIPDPESSFVQQPANGSCPQNWVMTMLLSGQQACVLTLPSLKGTSCPIGFILHDNRCEYVPQNSGGWQAGFCKSFNSDEIPPEWTAAKICDIPSPDPETTFLKPGPCPQNQQGQSWIPTTAESTPGSTQTQCLLTIPAVRGLCPIGFTFDHGRCDYVPQGRTSWQAGFCRSFSSNEVPVEWISNHICDIPSPDPETTFIKGLPCQTSWIETTNAAGQAECILTVPSVKGLCPVGFALDDSKCDYVPQDKVTWVIGFCKSFSSDQVPAEWISNHVCDTNPVPDPETTFIKAGPCINNWIPTVAEGGNAPKCVLTVPAIRERCPIGFLLDQANCDYIPRNIAGWQFPCSDQADGTANEGAIAADWLSGDSPETQSLTSNPADTDGTVGGRFEHTFAADTYGLTSVQNTFNYMLTFAFLLLAPVLILIGYQLMLAASSFRHAGALEGLSRVFLSAIAVGISFQLVTMLISAVNIIDSAIVNLHGMLGYVTSHTDGIRAAYTLVGVNEPTTSYRGIVMPMSRWGCALNDAIGILDRKFFTSQVVSWFPVISNLAPLATQVTNGAQLISRLTEVARLVLSVTLWLQAVIRIGLLNCYILTCPLAFACWSLPGGVGQQVVYKWTRGFLSMLLLQVAQLFFITALPLLLPTFPAQVGDHLGIMQILLTQLPPLVVLWLTVKAPKLLGISASRSMSMTGAMVGEMVGTFGAVASLLG